MDEIYYKQRLALNIPWRNMDSLKTANTWKETYNQTDISVWQLDLNIGEVENEDQQIEIREADPHEWMALAAAFPNVLPEEIPLGYRDIDREHNWFESAQKYPNVQENLKFISIQREAANEHDTDLPVRTFPLNAEQQAVVDFVTESQNQESECKQAIVMGAAGTGKSCVIHEIVRKIGRNKILLMAPTGVAANNIGGQTIHSALRLTISRTCRQLSGSIELDFQEQMSDISVILINEFSMIGLTQLGKIDMRLRQARPNCQDLPFGGFTVILFGDYNQLQPVCDTPMYGTPKLTNEQAVQGKVAYYSFKKIFRLNAVMRQVGESEQEFKSTLARLALGEVTTGDYELLSKRFLSNNLHLANDFENAVRLMATNHNIDFFNYEKLQKLNTPVTILKAVHNNATAANATKDEANGFEATLPICVGARVMLRQNLWMSRGLCNGTTGIVVDIVYSSANPVRGQIPTDLPLCILIRFDNYSGPALENNTLPIIPITTSFKKNSVNCTRKQYPLALAYAISIHRSQGLTLDKEVVDIGPNEFSLGMTYVGASRVRSISGLLFEPNFNLQRILGINKKKDFKKNVRNLLAYMLYHN